MTATNCQLCRQQPARVQRPSSGERCCRDCFFHAFEWEVHNTITTEHLFVPNERVAIAVSGGKDSTVLAYLMTTLNERYNYGLDLFLLAVDEGIAGYRDHSLEAVKRNEKEFRIPLKIISYEELYGYTMDSIVKLIGPKNNCTFCGVLRRQAMDRGALVMKATKICTGHNVDDAAETVFMNLVRGDVTRFARCSGIMTGTSSDVSSGRLPRCKPLMYAYEKEIVLYAHFKRLDYFSTECVYSPLAFRGHARSFVKALEASNPQLVRAVVLAATQFGPPAEYRYTVPGNCTSCGSISSGAKCNVCRLLDDLHSRERNCSTAVSSNPHLKSDVLNEAATSRAVVMPAVSSRCGGGRRCGKPLCISMEPALNEEEDGTNHTDHPHRS